MRRACGAGDASVAPVKATISSSVRPRECRKKTGSLIPARSPIRRAAGRSQNQNLVPPLKRKICVRSQTCVTLSDAVAQYFVIG